MTVADFNSNAIDWQKMQGLVPVIIQHHQTRTVLMLGYMNQTALAETLNTQTVTFYSRSKQRLWQKGETSGHFLQLVEIYLDCDHDALLILAQPQGPTCHLGTASCFSQQPPSAWQFLVELQALLQQRKQQPQTDSYTSQLFTAGISRIAQKVGEEGVEVALAAVTQVPTALAQGVTTQQPSELINEAADLLFHLMVLLIAKSLSLHDVIHVLQQRNHNMKFDD